MFVKAFLLVVLSLLPQSAAAFSCDTPQDAAKTHLDQLQTKGVWDPVAAAACFQLSDQNSDEAASLAIQLKQIMDARALYVDTDGLSQDPAYMDPKGIHRVQLHPNEKRVVVELIEL